MIIGSGAREHALSIAYERSPLVKEILATPGNDFMIFNRDKPVAIDKNCSLKDPNSLLDLAKKYSPDLIDVAQDDALAAGTVDLLKHNGFDVFGPTREAARIEWDKAWSREFMKRHSIPSPEYEIFSDHWKASDYVEQVYDKDPTKFLYIKASGLCGGKGALEAVSLRSALRIIREMADFEEAGETFLVEEGLFGDEFSYFAITDGTNCRFFSSAKDYKRLKTNDAGPQTGGMGAISPTLITRGLEEYIQQELIQKAIDGLRQEGNPFTGILYLGGIITPKKEVKVIEYNARWGDPECQAVLPGLKDDYCEAVLASLEGKLNEVEFRFNDKVRVCVVGVANGYPYDYSENIGNKIVGINNARSIKGVQVLGAGMEVSFDSTQVSGGRLLSVVGEGEDVIHARERAYKAIKQIAIVDEKSKVLNGEFYYREDIGKKDEALYKPGLFHLKK